MQALLQLMETRFNIEALLQKKAMQVPPAQHLFLEMNLILVYLLVAAVLMFWPV